MGASVREWWDDWGIPAVLIAVMVAVMGVGIYFGIESDNSQEAWCKAHHGVYSSTTATGVVVNTNGKPGISVTTIDYCQAADGSHLLKIWS